MQDRASHSAKASWHDLLLWLGFPAALMSVPRAGAVSTLEPPGRRGRTPRCPGRCWGRCQAWAASPRDNELMSDSLMDSTGVPVGWLICHCHPGAWHEAGT